MTFTFILKVFISLKQYKKARGCKLWERYFTQNTSLHKESHYEYPMPGGTIFFFGSLLPRSEVIVAKKKKKRKNKI